MRTGGDGQTWGELRCWPYSAAFTNFVAAFGSFRTHGKESKKETVFLLRRLIVARGFVVRRGRSGRA